MIKIIELHKNATFRYLLCGKYYLKNRSKHFFALF